MYGDERETSSLQANMCSKLQDETTCYCLLVTEIIQLLYQHQIVSNILLKCLKKVAEITLLDINPNTLQFTKLCNEFPLFHHHYFIIPIIAIKKFFEIAKFEGLKDSGEPVIQFIIFTTIFLDIPIKSDALLLQQSKPFSLLS